MSPRIDAPHKWLEISAASCSLLGVTAASRPGGGQGGSVPVRSTSLL